MKVSGRQVLRLAGWTLGGATPIFALQEYDLELLKAVQAKLAPSDLPTKSALLHAREILSDLFGRDARQLLYPRLAPSLTAYAADVKVDVGAWLPAGWRAAMDQLLLGQPVPHGVRQRLGEAPLTAPLSPQEADAVHRATVALATLEKTGGP